MMLTSPHLRIVACSWQKVGGTVFGDDGKLAEVITPTVKYLWPQPIDQDLSTASSSDRR